MANFKSSSLKIQFLAGFNGEKQLKKTRVYSSVDQSATVAQLEKVKDAIASVSGNSILNAETTVTKTL